MIWSILIATIKEREQQFENLRYELLGQIIKLNLENEVEVLFEQDNKEISIGAKRQKLLERATGDFINFIDDDDFPYPVYIDWIYSAIKDRQVDCVGMVINMTTNLGKPQRCCHSLKYKIWEDKRDGFDYVRNVTHFNPVKRELALKVGFQDRRFGEDHLYSDKLTELCKTETFIGEPLFHYRYSNLIPHAKKYGIK